jgi:hypothetical protein
MVWSNPKLDTPMAGEELLASPLFGPHHFLTPVAASTAHKAWKPAA